MAPVVYKRMLSLEEMKQFVQSHISIANDRLNFKSRASRLLN